MNFNFPYYAVVFFAGSMLALFFACVIFRRRPAPGATLFTIFVLAAALWIFAYGMEIGAVELELKVFWVRIEYIGLAVGGVAWFSFALDYTGSNWWRNRRKLLLISLIPAVTLALVWTSDWQSIYWYNPQLILRNTGPSLTFDYGIWYWIFAAYQYGLYVAGLAVLTRFGIKQPRLGRRQILLLSLGTVIPLAGDIVYSSAESVIGKLDLTPFLFTLAVLLYAVALFRLRFLDVIPTARGALVENMPDGVLVLDFEGGIADINPAAERMLGIASGSARGKKLDHIWPNLDIVRANLEPDKHTEFMMESTQGRLYLDISRTPLTDNQGAATGQLLMLRDISDHRKMEQTLQESESRYEALVEQSNEGVLIVQDGVYKFINSTLSEMTGFPSEEIVGRSLPFLITPEYQGPVLEQYRKLQSESLATGIFETILACRNADQKEIEISVGAITYDGHPANMVTLRDITERKQNQKKLESLYEEEHRLRNSVQEELDRRVKYTQTLVRELKTPLTSILACGEMLEDEVNNDLHRALVKNVRTASHNLDQRIDELIELARGEMGILKIVPMPLDYRQLLRDSVAEMGPVASAKGLVLISNIPDLPPVKGDHSRLRQVITNLLNNAIKFTSKGTVTLSAVVFNSESVLVQVKDTGKGIEKEEMENLFDPFLRKTHEGQDLGGLGIGLALSKMFIDLHQGKIWAESTPSSGSTFSFTVPVFSAAAEND